MTNQKSSPQNELFDNLVNSAFDFLEQSIRDFDNSKKFSVVNFAIALELFFKARLALEHWTMLASNVDSVDKDAFFIGDSHTVSLETAISRLERVTNEKLPKAAKKSFEDIRKHRNKYVHFAVQKNSDETKKLAGEQTAAWFWLHQLVAQEWKVYFSEYDEVIRRVHNGMHKQRKFLESKFENLKPEIRKQAMTWGSPLVKCPSCEFESATIKGFSQNAGVLDCHVCNLSGVTHISVRCNEPKCHQDISFTQHEGIPDHCPSCGAFAQGIVQEVLDHTDIEAYKAGYSKGNCPHCWGYETVVPNEDIFICTECFEFSDTMEYCEWCNGGQLGGGIGKHSYISGCEFCDGRAGYERD